MKNHGEKGRKPRQNGLFCQLRLSIRAVAIDCWSWDVDNNRVWQNKFQNAFDLSAFLLKNDSNTAQKDFQRSMQALKKSYCKRNSLIAFQFVNTKRHGTGRWLRSHPSGEDSGRNATGIR